MERGILHIDINSCFASIECLYRPEIRDKPVAVGGSEEARHGIILAKNQIAKKYGVKTGEALWQARQKCPELVIVQPNYQRYMRFSKMAREIYADYSDMVEPFGIDECWVDVTGTEKSKIGLEKLANEIRSRVKFELGITVSVGASYNKIFAKLGSDYKKPDAVTCFTRENFREKVWPLPASDMLYVGPSTERKLAMYGIHTIGQLAGTPTEYLTRWFGKNGLLLSCFANGLDTTPVMHTTDETVIKSIGNSTTAPRDLLNEEDVSIVMWMLCESVAERMRDQGLMCRTVQIGLRTNGLEYSEKQLRLPEPTCLAGEIHRAAMELVRGGYGWLRPLRSVGVRGCDLIPGDTPMQLTMLDDEKARQKRERLERAVDDIRRRFGHYAIGRAVTVSDSTLHNIDAKSDNTVHPVGYLKTVRGGK